MRGIQKVHDHLQPVLPVHSGGRAAGGWWGGYVGVGQWAKCGLGVWEAGYRGARGRTQQAEVIADHWKEGPQERPAARHSLAQPPRETQPRTHSTKGCTTRRITSALSCTLPVPTSTGRPASAASCRSRWIAALRPCSGRRGRQVDRLTRLQAACPGRGVTRQLRRAREQAGHALSIVPQHLVPPPLPKPRAHQVACTACAPHRTTGDQLPPSSPGPASCCEQLCWCPAQRAQRMMHRTACPASDAPHSVPSA